MPDTTNPPLAAYSLVPWVRRGLASLIAGKPATNYATLPVSLVVNTAAVPAPAVRLLGPGDVTSLDARAVIRTDPRDGADAFEPNYLASVDLLLPDLPWMLTPEADANGRLRPWICLIVVPDTQGVTLQVQPAGPAILRLGAPLDLRDELPNLDQIDAWAHAQVIGDSLSDTTLNTALDGNSTASLARLIAPRKLNAGQRYIACIVPTYRAGVNAGLGLAVDDNDLAPAWDANTQSPFTLPVYYSFRFQTGPDGDFASLARKIRPPQAPLDAGTRTIDASAPGFGLVPVADLSLDLEGALRTVGSQSKPWPTGAQATYANELRTALLPPPAPDPVVAPPTYGRTQSGAALSAASMPPAWLSELNLDPTTRAAAGAGSQVVQRDQNALVASAWDQLGEIRKANQLLRQAQLARQVSVSLNRRHLQTVAGDGVYLQITAPLHSRVSLALGGASATLRSQLETSRIPGGAVSPALRKLARPRGAIGRSLNVTGISQVVDRLNLPASEAKSLVVAGPVQTPRGMVAFDDVSSTIQVGKMTVASLQIAAGWKTTVVVSSDAPVVAAPAASPHATPVTAIHTVGLLATEHSAASEVTTTSVTPLIKLADNPDAPDILKGARTNLPPPLVIPTDQVGLAKTQANFRTAAGAISSFINAAAPPVAPDALPLGGTSALAPVRAQLVARIDPEDTIRSRVKARVPLGSGPDPLQPHSAGPQFPQPMYSALTELSTEWMLPGVSNVLMDTVVLLETNPRFVEAFMVGLNEELVRELLWHEYPVYRTGTFFQTFWGATRDGAPVADIPPIASFDANGHLGDHMADHATGGNLVLLIRGELFRRYPNALVSAVPATWNKDTQTRELGTPRHWPIFRGEIGPDISFFGFDITDPKGSDDPAVDPGWYFLIEEHATEPRFGLEPETGTPQDGSWNELSWRDSDVVLDHGFLNPALTLSVPSREGVTWGQNAAAMAYILMRRPVRVALHGRALLGGT